MLATLKQYYSDPLYRNSFFILLNSLTGAFFGFLFWMLAARLYSSEDVGLATAFPKRDYSGSCYRGIIRFQP